VKKRTIPALDCDRRILFIVVIITAVGASMVASSSSYFSLARFSDAYYLLKLHLVKVFIAAVFFWFAMQIDYRIYRRLSPAILALAVCLLLSLFVFGFAVRGSTRCLAFKSLNLTIQPAEIARFSLVLFLAYWISKTGRDFSDFKRGFLPAALAVLLVVGLITVQPNHGTAAATAIIGVLVLYLGGARLRHLGALIVTAGGVAAVRLWTEPHTRERIIAFIHSDEGLRSVNWQAEQSLIALGSGGWFGAGFGASRQKLSWLPDSHTDFIFSILGEEAGLAGTVIISFLFLLLILRALKISRQCGDTFGEILVMGLGCSVFVYAGLNMAIATGILPVTGLPLPFMSYGGSALVVNALSIGILLNVSKRRVKTQKRRGYRLGAAAALDNAGGGV